MTSILAVDQVSKYFGGVKANENISLKLFLNNQEKWRMKTFEIT